MDVTTAETALKLIRDEFCARIGKRTVWEKAFTIEPICNVADYLKFRRTIHFGPVRRTGGQSSVRFPPPAWGSTSTALPSPEIVNYLTFTVSAREDEKVRRRSIPIMRTRCATLCFSV